MLEEIIRPYMKFTPTQTLHHSQRLYISPPLQESTHTWLPTLNLFMPHTWKENADDNSSVAKNDDAAKKCTVMGPTFAIFIALFFWSFG